MMIQQKEISKMRRSTQYYREKIHKYRQHSRASLSPDRIRTRDTVSPVPSVDGTGVGCIVGEQSSFFSVGPSDVDRESSVAPSEHLEESPSYTPVVGGRSASSSTLRSNDKTPSSNRSTPQARSEKSPNNLSPLTATNDSLTAKNLKKLSAGDPERFDMFILPT